MGATGKREPHTWQEVDRVVSFRGNRRVFTGTCNSAIGVSRCLWNTDSRSWPQAGHTLSDRNLSTCALVGYFPAE